MKSDRLPPMEVARRLDRLRECLDDTPCEALVVSSPTNVLYLTGFEGSAGLLWVDGGKAILLTDGRYVEQAPDDLEKAGTSTEVEVISCGPEKSLNRLSLGLSQIGLEAGHATWGFQERLSTALESTRLVPTSGIVESLREIKDEGELARIEAAAAIADASLSEVWPMLEEEPSEREMASAIDETMRYRGATDRAFSTIVAAGPNSARPHARPEDRSIRFGDLVVFDLGAIVNGYRSDMTRSTRVGGTGLGWEAEMLERVLRSQKAGLNVVADGVAASEVDTACRAALEDMADAFVHGTGHGVGLDIHEAPTVSAKTTDTLQVGQVITVEPGVYFSGIGGVRWEDTVVVTESGYRKLTGFPSTI